mgnify:CR=1 FL=1
MKRAKRVNCCLCGKRAFAWNVFCGQAVHHPELAMLPWELGKTKGALCDECTLSAFYQEGLYLMSDVTMILGYWPMEDDR